MIVALSPRVSSPPHETRTVGRADRCQRGGQFNASPSAQLFQLVRDLVSVSVLDASGIIVKYREEFTVLMAELSSNSRSLSSFEIAVAKHYRKTRAPAQCHLALVEALLWPGATAGGAALLVRRVS